MCLARIAVISLFALSISCHNTGGGDNESFNTFQACWTDHHVDEGFDVPCAIEICCIDHPIGGSAANVVCGSDATSCDAYVTANLTDGSDASLGSDITTACTNYVFDSGRGGSGPGGQCSSGG